jgi:ubiquinone/menaquinone biosynthesis C-methylase UbiE
MAAPQMFSDGKAYERMMGRWSRVTGEQFVTWIDVPPGSRWADIGCGNGAFTQTLIERCAPSAVSALDPSEGQIAYARTRAGTELAEFRVGDSQALPYKDNEFDAAIMALVIAFVPNPAKAIAEMARVVRPGGMVATYMWDLMGARSPTSPVHAAIQALGLGQALPPSAEASRQEALRELWTATGLRSVETTVLRITVSYTDFSDFWDSFNVPSGPQGLLIQALPPEKREELRETLRSQLKADASGRIAYANAVKGKVPM